MERRLAAIMAADVVGYSRLMGEDEAGTLAALKDHRQELIDPEIAAHSGRIVKLMGDGALVEFASVVDAVECAVAIQQGMAGRHDGVADKQLGYKRAELTKGPETVWDAPGMQRIKIPFGGLTAGQLEVLWFSAASTAPQAMS